MGGNFGRSIQAFFTCSGPAKSRARPRFLAPGNKARNTSIAISCKEARWPPTIWVMAPNPRESDDLSERRVQLS